MNIFFLRCIAIVPMLVAFDGASAAPAFYPQWDVTAKGGGHVVVEMGDAEGRKQYALFDTGAASFGVSALSAGDWRQMTGQDPNSGNGVLHYDVPSRGKKIPCYRVRSNSRFKLGADQWLENVDIAYCETASFTAGQKLAALIGLRNLTGKIITMDYPARRWRIDTATSSSTRR